MEWYLPDRRIEVPEECDLSKAAEFLVSHTSRYPELVLTFDPEAKELFDSYQVFFNIRCTQRRNQQDAGAAAEEGAPHALSWTYQYDDVYYH